MNYQAALTKEQFTQAVERIPGDRGLPIEAAYRVLVGGEMSTNVLKEAALSRYKLYRALRLVYDMADLTRNRKLSLRLFDADSPCDACTRFEDCKEKHLSCEAFSRFVEEGEVFSPDKVVPTEAAFNSIFPRHPVTLERRRKRKAEFDAIMEGPHDLP